MGKTPDELEREIKSHRDRMSKKVRGLDERVRSDVQSAKSTLQDDVRERTHLNEYVEKRPLTTLLGAFGTGLLLGMATDVRGGGNGASSQQYRTQQQSAGGGMLGGLLGSASGLVSGPVQDEIRNMMRQVLGDQPKPTERRRTETETQPTMGVPDYVRQTRDGEQEHRLDNMREHATRNGG